MIIALLVLLGLVIGAAGVVFAALCLGAAVIADGQERNHAAEDYWHQGNH